MKKSLWLNSLITNEAVQQLFFDEDLTKITTRYPNEQFIRLVKDNAKQLHINVNTFFVKCLINLDEKIRIHGLERDESNALLMSSLLNEIDLAYVAKEDVHALMCLLLYA